MLPSPIDEPLYAEANPPLPASALPELLERHFGLQGELEELDGEVDLNFKLSCADGRCFVFKIHHPAADLAHLEAQDRAMEALARAGLPVPRALRPRGALELGAPVGDRLRALRLLDWVPGVPMVELQPLNPRQLFALGEVMARADLALAPLPLPPPLCPILWDVQACARLAPALGWVPDPVVARAAGAMVERYEAELAGRLRRWPRQLLHNDANPSNVLYDSADTDRISGVFDFGDLVVGAPVQELAVAATYVLREGLGGADPLSSVGWVVSGWASARPVEEEELAMLIELIALRAAVSVMITSWRSRVFPEEAPYLLRNFAANHAALAFLAALPRGPAVQALRAAAARRPWP